MSFSAANALYAPRIIERKHVSDMSKAERRAFIARYSSFPASLMSDRTRHDLEHARFMEAEEARGVGVAVTVAFWLLCGAAAVAPLLAMALR